MHDGASPAAAEDDLQSVLEAMLFAAHEPLSARRLASALHGIDKERVDEALEALRQGLEGRRSPLQLVELAGGWRLVTRPEFAPFLSRLFHKSEKERLSAAAIETLAIIAYRQPVTRADIEGIRGVQAGPMLKALRDRKLIKIVGRAEVVGRPAQYGTTTRFLDHFGLSSLRQLPALFGEEQSFVRAGEGAALAPDMDVDPDSLDDPFEEDEDGTFEAGEDGDADAGSTDGSTARSQVAGTDDADGEFEVQRSGAGDLEVGEFDGDSSDRDDSDRDDSDRDDFAGSDADWNEVDQTDSDRSDHDGEDTNDGAFSARR